MFTCVWPKWSQTVQQPMTDSQPNAKPCVSKQKRSVRTRVKQPGLLYKYYMPHAYPGLSLRLKTNKISKTPQYHTFTDAAGLKSFTCNFFLTLHFPQRTMQGSLLLANSWHWTEVRGQLRLSPIMQKKEEKKKRFQTLDWLNICVASHGRRILLCHKSWGWVRWEVMVYQF